MPVDDKSGKTRTAVLSHCGTGLESLPYGLCSRSDIGDVFDSDLWDEEPAPRPQRRRMTVPRPPARVAFVVLPEAVDARLRDLGIDVDDPKALGAALTALLAG